MSNKYRAYSGFIEQVKDIATKRVFGEIYNWISSMVEISGIDPHVPPGVINKNSLQAPGVVASFNVTGNNGVFQIQIQPPTGIRGILYYQIQSSLTLPFETSTSLNTYGPSSSSWHAIADIGVSRYWRVRCKFTNSDYGKWFILSTPVSSGGSEGQILFLDDFGAVGDGVTDDLIPLTNFINAVMASEVKWGIMSLKTYATSGSLPDINVSGVRFFGGGVSGIHNVGTVVTGTVIKYTGAPGATVWKIAPIEDAGGQYLENPQIYDITIDNDSLSDTGWDIKSCRGGFFRIGSFNATGYGCKFGVVTTLGDPRDLQRNEIWYNGRQWEEPDGVSLLIDGDAGANVSLNMFNLLDIVYKNSPGIISVNPDNNDWLSVRLFKHPAGTATYCWLWQGSDTGVGTSSEVVHYLSCSDTIYCMGTDVYVNPSIYNRVLEWDNGNSGALTTPFTFGTGAIAWFQDKFTPIWNGKWANYTPTVTPDTGSFTTLNNVKGRWQRTQHGINFWVSFGITTLGTAGGTFIKATLPVNCSADGVAVANGKETAVTNKQLTGLIPGGSGFVYIQDYSGAFIGANGYAMVVQGFYETSASEV